ncbi:hypothetical protein J7S33_07190, partial [Saccharothrix algeriensis]
IYLGQVVLSLGKPLPAVACVILIAAGYVAARSGLEWRYRSVRLATKERDHLGHHSAERASEGGFANRVGHSFAHYFARYVPSGTDRELWLARTAGIRTTLRDEVVELYRESRVPV